MAHSIKNPEILHWVENDGHYACNKAVKPTIMKTALSVKEVTCANCKSKLESRKLDAHLTKFLHADRPGWCFSDNQEVWEMIGRASMLEEEVETLRRYAKNHRITVIRDTREHKKE